MLLLLPPGMFLVRFYWLLRHLVTCHHRIPRDFVFFFLAALPRLDDIRAV